MALSKKQLQDVCGLWLNHLECRYLDHETDDQGNPVYMCQKLSPQKKIIDEEVQDFLVDCKKKGVNPLSEPVPLGNNCKGYIRLTTKMQGYDLPGG